MEETPPETPGPTQPDVEIVDPPEAKPGVDKLLVAICAGLWVVALIVLFVKAPGMRVNWQLGNLKQALDVDQQVDEDAVKNLVELAKTTDVVGMLRTELEEGAQFEPYRQDKILYRIAVLQVLVRIPGDPAFEAICAAINDPDPRVRRFSYVALRTRVEAELSDRREAAVSILEGANREPDVVSRVVAIQQVAGLEALPEALETRLLGAWPFLDGLRNARDGGEESPNHVVRRACLEGLQALVGGAAELTFDPSADQATRDAQLEALEAWFEANGGERPDGVPSFSEWAASLAEPDASGDPTSPESGDGAGK
ncbi:MAG: hypothetical protein KDD82_27030 [Planctomycetes bacterium]|nr:hypothetical protein [Planctomycetota bacterium]